MFIYCPFSLANTRPVDLRQHKKSRGLKDIHHPICTSNIETAMLTHREISEVTTLAGNMNGNSALKQRNELKKSSEDDGKTTDLLDTARVILGGSRGPIDALWRLQ